MNFKEILEKADIDNVLEILRVQYESTDNDIEGYRILVSVLLTKDPSPSRCQISINHINQDGYEYDHVSGTVPGEELSQGIEFSPREEWLGMELSADTLKNYSTDEIIAHCLWEMTFFGFSDEEVNCQRKILIDSDDEYENVEDKNGNNHENTVRK